MGWSGVVVVRARASACTFTCPCRPSPDHDPSVTDPLLGGHRHEFQTVWGPTDQINSDGVHLQRTVQYCTVLKGKKYLLDDTSGDVGNSVALYERVQYR